MGFLSKLFNREIPDAPIQQIPDTPNPEQPINTSGEAFHMTVEAVFTITGKGTVVTGRVDSGEVRVGQTININGSRPTKVLGIEMFRNTLNYAKAGDNCGILLEGVNREEIHMGDQLSN